MKIWLHRISHCYPTSSQLLEKGYLSIGFSSFKSEDFIEKTINEGWEYFEGKWREKKRTRYDLWRFLNEFRAGDWMLVPSWETFSIYELEDTPKLFTHDISKLVGINNAEKIDIGFVWKVKPKAENICRKNIANSALIARMKVRNTNVEITDLKDGIELIVHNYINNIESNLYTNMLNGMVEGLEKMLSEYLNPDKFEKLIKWYFYKIGATSVDIPAKNESGKENGADADIIATFEPIKVIIYVQAKYHTGQTGHWAIKQIIEYKNQKENKDNDYTYIPWVISCAEEYSNEAIAKAREESVVLINRSELAKRLLDCGIEDIDSAFS